MIDMTVLWQILMGLASLTMPCKPYINHFHFTRERESSSNKFFVQRAYYNAQKYVLSSQDLRTMNCTREYDVYVKGHLNIATSLGTTYLGLIVDTYWPLFVDSGRKLLGKSNFCCGADYTEQSTAIADPNPFRASAKYIFSIEIGANFFLNHSPSWSLSSSVWRQSRR